MEKYRNYRWFGRLTGFLGLVFFVSFFLGRGLEVIKASNSNFDLLFILTLFSFALVANVIGWLIEIVGGFLLLLCGLALGSIILFSDVFGTLMYTFAFSLPFLIPGVFFLIAWKIKYNAKSNGVMAGGLKS
jgi:hypothetical protein